MPTVLIHYDKLATTRYSYIECKYAPNIALAVYIHKELYLVIENIQTLTELTDESASDFLKTIIAS